MIRVSIDGLCEPKNPGGIATYGYVIDGDLNEVGNGFVGKGKSMSNNVAEYAGLIAVLQLLLHFGANDEKIMVSSDSQLLVKQMSGEWKIHKGLYVFYCKVAKRFSGKFSNLRFRWIPREKNTKADQLARDAYKEYCKLDSIQKIL